MTDITLDSALKNLRDTYKSIDLRAILIRSDHIYYTPFLKIRPTIQDKSELKTIYQEKRSIWDQNNPIFQIVYEARNISELDGLLQQIQKMHIVIDGSEAKPIGLDSQNIFDYGRYISLDSNYITELENSIYQHRIFFTTMENSLYGIMERLGIGSSDLRHYGLQIQDLNSLLDTTNVNLSNNIVITFPIYCKSSPLLSNEFKENAARFIIHDSLVSKSKYSLMMRNSSEVLVESPSERLDKIANYKGEFAEINIPKPKKEIKTDYSISIFIQHDVLGTIATTELKGSQLISRQNLERSRKVERPNRSNLSTTDLDPNLISKVLPLVFIIHGHDLTAALELEKLLKKEWNIDSIILKDKPGAGKTIIEKFEEEAIKASFAFALLTPDDIIDAGDSKYLQARPNVIFELGWFYGKLGRDKVCILMKKETMIHSDLAGVSRINFIESITEKIFQIRDELKIANIID